MHRRSGSGGGGGNYGAGRYNYGASQQNQMYDREFMDEMAFRREMIQRGMMGDMSFYGGMGMNTMGMGMNPMGGMMMGNMGGSGGNNQSPRGMVRNDRGGGGGGGNRDNRNKPGQRGGNMGQRRDGRNDVTMQQRGGGGGAAQRQGGGMQRNRSDPGQGPHQRRLSDMRNDRDQTRRRDRDQQQWDRRGGPQNLQIKETGPLGKIKAISRRIKEWGNFGHGLPYWTKRANIYRRFSNFLERGSLDHTIVFIGHGSDCVCRIYVDELYLAEGSGASKSEARSDAYYRAVERLRLRNFDTVINKDDKFAVESLRGFEVDQVISESPSNSITFESNYAHIATNRIADFNYAWDKLVIVERAGMSNAGLKLRLSSNLNGMLLEQNTSKAVPPGETKPKWRFAISLEHKPLSEAFHERQGIARSNACIEAMKKLEPMCWRLKVDRHRFPKLKTVREDRRRGQKGDDKKDGDKKGDDKKDGDKKADTSKTEEKKKTETKAEEKEAEADTSLVKEEVKKEGELDQSKDEEKHEEEEEEHHDEETDEPFVPPVADLKRVDLIDPEETAKGEKEDEEEEKEEKEEGKEEQKEEDADDTKDDTMEEEEEDKKEGDEKKESSKLEQRLKQKIESDAKQRKKSEFLFKIRKALEEKLQVFSATRNFGQLVLEGFWMEERDHVVRLCRKLKMRSYVDKYRKDDGKIIHFIFVSQIIPMEELVSTLKKSPDMRLGLYSLHVPKPVEMEVEGDKEEKPEEKKEEEKKEEKKEEEKEVKKEPVKKVTRKGKK